MKGRPAPEAETITSVFVEKLQDDPGAPGRIKVAARQMLQEQIQAEVLREYVLRHPLQSAADRVGLIVYLTGTGVMIVGLAIGLHTFHPMEAGYITAAGIGMNLVGMATWVGAGIYGAADRLVNRARYGGRRTGL